MCFFLCLSSFLHLDFSLRLSLDHYAKNKHLKLIDRTAAESAGGGIERRWRKAGLE